MTLNAKNIKAENSCRVPKITSVHILYHEISPAKNLESSQHSVVLASFPSVQLNVHENLSTFLLTLDKLTWKLRISKRTCFQATNFVLVKFCVCHFYCSSFPSVVHLVLLLHCLLQEEKYKQFSITSHRKRITHGSRFRQTPHICNCYISHFNKCHNVLIQDACGKAYCILSGHHTRKYHFAK